MHVIVPNRSEDKTAFLSQARPRSYAARAATERISLPGRIAPSRSTDTHCGFLLDVALQLSNTFSIFHVSHVEVQERISILI